MHLITRTKVHAAILGAGAPITFLGATSTPAASGQPRSFVIDEATARKNVAGVSCPLLILVGTSDSLIDLNRNLYEQMSKANKSVRMEIYANGYHDFVIGPQGHPGRKEPLLDATLDALERALSFMKNP